MNKTKILILAANPTDTGRLRLSEEVREIETALKLAKSREQFEIIPKFAVRVDDLRRALLEHAPQIVHFSGHGTGENGIVLENEAGQMKLVNTASLARLFKFFGQDIHCIFLNACFSEGQAEAICQHIDYVIGMNQAIGDRAAIEFAKGFYDALGAGRSIEDAFEMGCVSIDLESIPESATPVLKPKASFRTPASNSTTDLNSISDSTGLASKSRKLELLPRNAPVAEPEQITLEEPEGQVPLNSLFYIDRHPIEEDCYEAIARPGTLIRIKAPRQMGKTSLMSRILHYAERQGYQAVNLSFQSADAKALKDLDLFLRWFCISITNELNLSNPLNDYWKDDFLGAKDKCTNYFQRYLLNQIQSPIALGLDEVDEVFKHSEVAADFFGLLRAWHERGKNHLTWQKLRLVITHSKEVYIPLDINQSPFNVGLSIELPVLNRTQVQNLLERHRLAWDQAQLERLMTLLGGHPYLVRVALYQIARRRMTLEKLQQVGPTEEGPYSDHLRRHLLNLEETRDKDLLAAVRTVMSADGPVNVGVAEAFKLCSMGIVKLQGNDVIPLCELYRQYFRGRLGVDR